MNIVTVTFGSTVIAFQFVLSEFSGVASSPMAGTTSSANAAGPTLNSGCSRRPTTIAPAATCFTAISPWRRRCRGLANFDPGTEFVLFVFSRRWPAVCLWRLQLPAWRYGLCAINSCRHKSRAFGLHRHRRLEFVDGSPSAECGGWRWSIERHQDPEHPVLFVRALYGEPNVDVHVAEFRAICE